MSLCRDHPDNHMAIMARFLRHANEFDYDDDDADDDDEVPVFPRHNRRRRRSPDSDEDAPRTRPRLSVHGHDSQHRSMPGHSVPVASHTWRGHAPALERTMSDIYPPQGSRTPSTPRTIETIYGEAPSFFGMAMTPPMEAAGNMSPSVSASQRQHSGRGAGFVGAGPGDGLLSMTPGHTGSGLTQLAMVADLRLEPSYARTSSGANGRAASAASAPHHAAQGGSMGQGRPLPSQAVPDSMCPQGHAGSQSHRATRAGPRDSFLGEFLLPSPNGQAENTNNRRTTMDWPAQHEE